MKRSQNGLRFLFSIVVATVVLSLGAAMYMHFSRGKSRLPHKLALTADKDETLSIVQQMLRSEGRHADDGLSLFMKSLPECVFSEEHRVLFWIDDGSNHPRFITKGSIGSLNPKGPFDARNVRIAEEVPEALTIALDNSANDSVCLYFFTCRHSGQICDLSAEEALEWKSEGFWKRYVRQRGHPIDEGPRRLWHADQERDYLRWRKWMKEKFNR